MLAVFEYKCAETCSAAVVKVGIDASPHSGLVVCVQAEDGIRDLTVTGVQTCALPILVLSLEMSAQQIVQRMLCAEAKVDSQAVRTGYLSSSDWHRLTAAAGRLSEASIFIDDSPGPTLLEAPAQARRMKAQHRLQLPMLD